MYDRLMVIKTTDNSMYTRILNAITLTNWVHSAMKNVNLHELLHFQTNVYGLFDRITAFLTNKVVRYSPTKESLLMFLRNGGAHLTKDYSLDLKGMGTQEALKAALKAAK